MNSSTFRAPEPLSLYRPWPRRLWADVGAWWRRGRQPRPPAEADYASLAHLADRTLRDLGGPDRLQGGDPADERRRLDRMRW